MIYNHAALKCWYANNFCFHWLLFFSFPFFFGRCNGSQLEHNSSVTNFFKISFCLIHSRNDTRASKWQNFYLGVDSPFNDLWNYVNILYSILKHMMRVWKCTAEQEWSIHRKLHTICIGDFFCFVFILFVLRMILFVQHDDCLFLLSCHFFLKLKANLFLVSVLPVLLFVLAVTSKQYSHTGFQGTKNKHSTNKHLTTKIQTEQCLYCSDALLKPVFIELKRFNPYNVIYNITMTAAVSWNLSLNDVKWRGIESVLMFSYACSCVPLFRWSCFSFKQWR